jgi:1-acyl-sn-glycerol-3-phosphate acyltransferase
LANRVAGASEGFVLHFIARVFLKITGWTPMGDSPTVDRYVFIAAPHTSNWDLVWMIAFALYFRMPMRWVGKKSIFKPPFGGIMRMMGGIAVDRSKRGNQVQAMASLFDEQERMPGSTGSRASTTSRGLQEFPSYLLFSTTGAERGGSARRFIPPAI